MPLFPVWQARAEPSHPLDRFDVIFANPPFGGKERKEIQQNFPIKTGETAFLFLQHFIKSLKAGGRAGVVIKNTFFKPGFLDLESVRFVSEETYNERTRRLEPQPGDVLYR